MEAFCSHRVAAVVKAKKERKSLQPHEGDVSSKKQSEQTFDKADIPVLGKHKKQLRRKTKKEIIVQPDQGKHKNKFLRKKKNILTSKYKNLF